MSGRLNILQKTMLEWNKMHPYNAVHVVRVPNTLDAVRLHKVVNETLEARGLTGLTLNRDEGTFRYRGGTGLCDIKVLPCGDDPLVAIWAETERELNTAFAESNNFNPFRFFLVSGAESFFLGLTYFHAVADAESVVLLLKGIVEAYSGTSGRVCSGPLDLYPPPWDRLLRSHRRPLARKIIGLPALIRNMRASCRPKYRDPLDLVNRFASCSIAPENFRFLLSTAKSSHISLNDLLLALLMKCVSTLAMARNRAGRRKKISVGCIVNVRKDLQPDSQQAFGLFLGSFVVTHEVPHGISLAGLANDVGNQTRRIKLDKLYLAAPVELGFARFMLRWFSPERRKKLYPKNYPLWGGITNMNLNSIWPQRNGDRPVDYFRAVSTGPATPLVLSVTTVGEAANISISYRRTVFSAEDIKLITDCFENPQRQLAAWA
jgi:NRPS condensation-like uncharacterized protein